MTKLIRFSTIFTVFALSCAAYAVDMDEVEKELTTSGVQGWIHASIADQGLYVFTYRTPGHFFDYVEMTLVPSTSGAAQILKTLGRHDLVKIKGKFLKIPSPQKHISAAAIELVTKFKSDYPTEPYQYQVKIPDDLLKVTNALFFVHAIGGDGHILVTEYKDVVLPVAVKNGDLTKNLYRNDLVRLNIKIIKTPNGPMHLTLDESTQNPIQVIDAIKDKNGKPADVEGVLVMFPKSPEIITTVFAVGEDLDGGAHRQYTILNMTNPDTFQKIHDFLQKEWDKFPGEYTNGRNKLFSKRIRVRVKGTFNEVDPSQANPQIFVDSTDQISFKEN